MFSKKIPNILSLIHLLILLKTPLIFSKNQYYSIQTAQIQNETAKDIIQQSNNTEFQKSIDSQNENSPKFTTIELTTYRNVKYLGDIYVGTPYKKYQVIYDTGSDIFWLASNNCTTASCEKYENKYNPKLSSTSVDLHLRQNITYAVGFVKGRIFEDIISLNYNQNPLELFNKELKVKNLNILCIFSENYITETIADGVVGLGINYENNKNSSLIHLLYEQKQILSPAFSFYLINNTENNISKLYIGDIMENTYINNLFKSSIRHCKVAEEAKYWECNLKKGIEMINNKTNNSFWIHSNLSVIFDTGTSYTIIPKSDYSKIIQHLNKDLHKNCHTNQFEQLVCECNSIDEFGDIKLYFDEDNFFEIHLAQLIKYKENMRYQCRYQVMVDSIGVNKWIVGHSSLRNNLVSFNMQERKISFIQNIKQTLDENQIANSNLLIRGLFSKKIIWIGLGILLIVLIIIIYIFK